MMVRKGGFEPPRLSAPPPQDGVSASSTTSALCNFHALNNLNRSASEGISGRTGFCTDLLHSTRVSGCGWLPPVRQTASQPHPRAVHVAHGGFHAIVSRYVLQWKRSEYCRATARNVYRSACRPAWTEFYLHEDGLLFEHELLPHQTPTSFGDSKGEPGSVKAINSTVAVWGRYDGQNQ
jgi:hypothetical protein